MCCMLFRQQIGVFAGGLRRCSLVFVDQSVVEVFWCGCRFIIGDVFAGVVVSCLVFLTAKASNLHVLVVVLIFACF